MAYLVLVVSTGDSIVDFNQKLGTDNTRPNEVVAGILNYLTKMQNGTSGTIQVTTRDSDPSVSTSGSGSAQYTVTV